MICTCTVCNCLFVSTRSKKSCSPQCLKTLRGRARSRIRYKRKKTRKTRYKSGFKADIGITVRSGWEANVARILNLHKIPFLFESQPYVLTLANGKTVGYLPDFHVDLGKGFNVIIEVKGKYIKSLYKPRLLAQQYNVTVYLIDQEIYKSLEKEYKSLIPLWE
jgi:hypothetical protein